MYTDNDNKNLQNNIENIRERIDKIILSTLEPTIDTRWAIIHTIQDFVISKKRKIYGGFALNELIKRVAPNDTFYDAKNVKHWDIDFYSPDPITDAIELTNILHEKGFKHIRASEALHDETYKIYVETEEFADITYVPRPIYNKIPYENINNMIITGSHWLMIDYIRILTDPLTSYFRLDKIFPRLCTLVKHFPLPHNNSSIEIEPPERDLKIAFETIHNYLIDKKTCIVVGMYGYNHLLNESKITNRKMGRTRTNKNTHMNFVDVNYYEIISTDYVSDAKNIIVALKNTFQNSENKITYEEHYPYFQFFGFNVIIYYENEVVCKIYNYNNRCIPYKTVPALYFTEGKYIRYNGYINIGTYGLLVLYCLINTMYAKTYTDHRSKNLYYTLLSHMIEMKKYYFKTYNKNIFDNTLFQEFVLNCKGYTMSAVREKQERIQKKKESGKSTYIWSYYPENNVGKEVSSTYIFANSSGNIINNISNRKLLF